MQRKLTFTKNSPLAKGLRTFAASMTGVLTAAVVADWVGNFKASMTVFGLGTIAAAVAGVSAGLLAFSSVSPTTPVGKALATAAQYLGAGLVTIGIADLTESAVEDFGKSVLRIVIAAVVSGLVSLSVNAAEDGGTTPPEPVA